MHKTNRPTISTHVLDTTRGEPAPGVHVTLSRVDGERAVPQATRETDADGRIHDLVTGELRPGAYRLAFDVTAYFERRGAAAFFSRVVLDFDVTDAGRSYHIPLLLSPFSWASYRGS